MRHDFEYFDFATRRSTTVARNLGNVGVGLTASPDGRTILYSRTGLLRRRPDAGGELPLNTQSTARAWLAASMRFAQTSVFPVKSGRTIRGGTSQD